MKNNELTGVARNEDFGEFIDRKWLKNSVSLVGNRVLL